jgi:GAF domain-containing protein
VTVAGAPSNVGQAPRSPLAPEEGAEQTLLDRAATALNSPLELKDVLRLLAGIALDGANAEHCSVFLFEDDRLYPAVAVAAHPDERLWSAFRAMGPVELLPEQQELLLQGRALPVEDTGRSTVVPAHWAQTFGLGSVILAPLATSDQPCGLLIADWPEPRRFDLGQLEVLNAVATYASRAIAGARPFEIVRRRARLQEALARGAAALALPLQPSEIVERLAGAYTELLQARVCGVALVDDDHTVMTTVATANTRRMAPIPLTDIPDQLVRYLGETWARTKKLLDLEDDPWIAELLGSREAGASWYVVLPLLNEGHTQGGVLLGFDPYTRLDAEERAAAEALAAIGAAALERHGLLESLDRQVRRLNALYQASAVLAAGADARALVSELNRLLATHGIEVVGVTFRDQSLARHLGGDEPTPEERAGWRRGDGWAEVPGRWLAVPMRLGKRLMGALRVQPTVLQPGQRAFIEALAGELAAVAHRGALRAAVEEAARERAVAAEREQFAADLHDTAGQGFVAMGLLARCLAEQLPPESEWSAPVLRLAELADQGKHEIDELEGKHRRNASRSPGPQRVAKKKASTLEEPT